MASQWTKLEKTIKLWSLLGHSGIVELANERIYKTILGGVWESLPSFSELVKYGANHDEPTGVGHIR